MSQGRFVLASSSWNSGKSVQILQLTGGTRGTTVSIGTKKTIYTVHIGINEKRLRIILFFLEFLKCFEGIVIKTQSVWQYILMTQTYLCCSYYRAVRLLQLLQGCKTVRDPTAPIYATADRRVVQTFCSAAAQSQPPVQTRMQAGAGAAG